MTASSSVHDMSLGLQMLATVVDCSLRPDAWVLVTQIDGAVHYVANISRDDSLALLDEMRAQLMRAGGD